jgi:DHA2 family multidrug resistance protein-like MFS transporter
VANQYTLLPKMIKQQAQAAARQDGLAPGPLRWATVAILLGTFMGTLDASIANVALPTIAHDLHSAAADAVWVVNAYQIAMAVAVLPLAALGERLGYKRIFLAGLAIFTLASGLCAAAPTLPLLVVARMLQGLGGACMSTIVPALLRTVFPSRRVGTGIGYLALTVAVGAALGPTVAAGILSVAGWRWLFAVNLPVGLIDLFLASRLLPHNEGVPRPFDAPGAVLNTIALTLLIVGLGSLGNAGGQWLAIAAIVGGSAAAALLVLHQRGRTAPLVPLDLLRIPMLRLSAGTSICSYTAQTMAMLALPFLLVAEMGRSPSATGLLLTPWPLVIVIVAPLSGRLSDRYRSEVVGAIGLAVFSLGLGTLLTLSGRPADVDLVWRMALCGIGFGLFQTPNNRILLTCAPPQRSGAAGGLMTMARLIGMTLGAALATVLLDLEGTRGANTALLAATAAAGLGLVVSAWRMRPPRRSRGGGNP